MSNKPYKGFEPKWVLTPAPEGSYRSIFRWGDPEFFKYPKESLYKLMKETFKMTDDDFKDYTDDIGFDKVDLSDYPSKIDQKHVEALKKIVGDDFVTTEDYPRLAVAYGCTGYDLCVFATNRLKTCRMWSFTPTQPNRWNSWSRTRSKTKSRCMSTAAAARSPAAWKRSRAA